jgi:hypothetical protein
VGPFCQDPQSRVLLQFFLEFFAIPSEATQLSPAECASLISTTLIPLLESRGPEGSRLLTLACEQYLAEHPGSGTLEQCVATLNQLFKTAPP